MYLYRLFVSRSSDNHLLEKHRSKRNSSALVELILELYPVKAQSMERALQQVHTHEYAYSCAHKHEETEEENDDISGLETSHKTVIEKHFGQLRMGKTKSPKSQITSSIRYCSKDKFNCLDQLVDHNFAKTVCTVASLAAKTSYDV